MSQSQVGFDVKYEVEVLINNMKTNIDFDSCPDLVNPTNDILNARITILDKSLIVFLFL